MEEPLDEAENTPFKLQLGGEVSIKELLRPSDTFVEQHWGMGGIGNKSSENYEGWAVDINEYACESLKLNHPETQVRNESAQNFLSLIKEWAKLCEEFVFKPPESAESDEEADDEESENQSVQWKSYGSSYDTWEPIEGVRNETAENFLSLIKECAKLCEEFVFKPPESAKSDEEADDEEPENQSDSEEFEGCD
ncbi:DNA (cytosine-5)-methyltransferase [Trifolium pratense]|uniref:DNA (Cytosine-5)-methyltransferase n=1 Tax=Trifolium pratense TaxID=57577 RepID=A0A2K3P5B3_TRIPR|nr:DNA (cytosine-5)-methyltransferase [Trifolium pratense]